METKKNSAGEQQPMKSNGEYASYNSSVSNDVEIKTLKEKLFNTKDFRERVAIKRKIKALEEGFNSVEDYLQNQEKIKNQTYKEYLEKEKRREEAKQKNKIIEEKNVSKEQEGKNLPHKNSQLEIIQKYNPMRDDYHTGIRKVSDIKTFEEAFEDEESFEWGDFTKEDAKKSLESGFITIYSSYPIKQGVFVSTSRKQAEEYAGGKGKNIFSKKIPLNEVAWINGDEGQYANVDEYNFTNKLYGENKYSKLKNE